MGKLKHTTTKGGSAIPAHTTTPQVEGLTPSQPHYLTRVYEVTEYLETPTAKYKLEIWQTVETVRYGCAQWHVLRYDPVWRGWWIEATGYHLAPLETAERIGRFALRLASGIAARAAAQETDGANHG